MKSDGRLVQDRISEKISKDVERKIGLREGVGI